MRVTPPSPGIWADTPITIRKLKWSPVESDIGELVGGWLALASGGAGPVLWFAGEATAPVGIAPRYLSRDAFLALRDGDVAQSGSIGWNGARWRLADVAEGARLVARLIAEGTTA